MTRFRDLAASDLDRVLEINQANTPNVGDVDLERLSFILDEASIALGAVHEGALIGFVLVLGPGSTYDSVNYRWFVERSTDLMYLDRVAVAAGHRGRGLGSSLYSAVFERIASHHPEVNRLGLEVNIDPPNPGSLAFHRRLGFVEVGRQSTPYGAVVSLMERPIDSDR